MDLLANGAAELAMLASQREAEQLLASVWNEHHDTKLVEQAVQTAEQAGLPRSVLSGWALCRCSTTWAFQRFEGAVCAQVG